MHYQARRRHPGKRKGQGRVAPLCRPPPLPLYRYVASGHPSPTSSPPPPIGRCWRRVRCAGAAIAAVAAAVGAVPVIVIHRRSCLLPRTRGGRSESREGRVHRQAHRCRPESCLGPAPPARAAAAPPAQQCAGRLGEEGIVARAGRKSRRTILLEARAAPAPSYQVGVCTCAAATRRLRSGSGPFRPGERTWQRLLLAGS